MGGPRASTEQQIRWGQRCCNCSAWLGERPTRPAERYCARCEPRQRILFNVDVRHWSIHFIDTDGRTRIGPWLLLLQRHRLYRVIRWGHISREDACDLIHDLRQWGRSSVNLHLTRIQRSSLIARGLGWPWNGYELTRMLQEGKYPPERLTRAQEAAFLRSRRP